MQTILERKVVYFDANVRDASGNWIGGTWIGLDNARQIAAYFKGRGFKQKDSGELGKWMNQILISQNCGDTILVFAQDVAPYDVFDDDSSNALIRQYLDNGGTILWMGDIPFFYRTEWEKNHFKLNDFMDRSDPNRPMRIGRSHIHVLGVIPVSMVTASRFSITWTSRKYGLRSTWASLRPIVIPSQLQTDRTRISNFLLRRKEYIELAHVEGVGSPSLLPFERKGHMQRFLEFLGTSSFKTGPVEVSSQPKEKSSIEFGTKYLSAWIKLFNANIRGSGFIRIWDYSPRIITYGMLEEAFTLLKRYCKKNWVSEMEGSP